MILIVPAKRKTLQRMKKATLEKVLQKSKSWSIDELKKNKNNNVSAKRFLISIYVLGGSGPLLLVVNEEAVVGDVIEMAMKSYARQGRIPVLGSDANSFGLYCSHDVTEALSSSEPIGSFGTRKFMLCQKEPSLPKTEARPKMATQRGIGGWKSLSFKIRSALVCAYGSKT